MQPDLLIMDEPSTGLAPKIVKDILRVLGGLRERGISLLLVEQNVALVSEIADRGYVMSVGKIVHTVGPGEWAGFLADEKLVKAYLGG
jgi:branched-chain amino acid transport system ATP-binding protein/nonpolar-amino-acid-transporting ATPase